MDLQDKTLKCKDCGQDFIWTSSEQQFYKDKGFENSPLRCKDCRRQKKARFNEGRGGGQARQMFDITCGQCGASDKVPFSPRGDKPVLCKNCFQSQRA